MTCARIRLSGIAKLPCHQNAQTHSPNHWLQPGRHYALVREFTNRGYHVFAAVRNPNKAAHFSNAQDIEVVTLDVTSSESISGLIADLKDRLPEGKLDILVNNAGFIATGPLIEADLATAKRLYDVNVLGLLAVTQAFAPMLIAAKGKVVNMSSVGGILAMPWSGLYDSSKAAVTILSETLRLELAPLGVNVITGMLGNIESNIHINDSWQGMPESSRYKSVEAHIAKTAEGQVGPKKEKADDFARRFASDILKGYSGQVWRGAMAQTTRVVGHHAPMSLLDSLLLPGSGLDAMAKDTARE